MTRNNRFRLKAQIVIAVIVFVSALCFTPEAHAQGLNNRNGIRRVLLISIDGMHAADYLNCSKGLSGVNGGKPFCPQLAQLGQTGVNYTRTTTARPSDSFPGLMALVSGGTPKTVGAFYDVAYDRVLAPPINATGNGLPGAGLQGCIPGRPNGTQTEYEEGVEFNQTLVNGGGPYAMFDGGTKSIDPTKLERDPFNGCQPVYPWNFVRTNTIYGVIHAAGGYTAWADKHPVYASVSGPTGTSVPSNIDDYYSPEVNSDIVPIPGLSTATGFNCGSLIHTGDDWTTDFNSIQCNDQLKVNAIVNEINGRNHLGTRNAPVPTLLGMNFQAVSVGQKLIEHGVKGGYLDAAATPTAPMLRQIEYVDAAIGQMVAALKNQGLLGSTAIIITAKHGQSPIDTHRFFPIPGHSGTNGMPPSAVIGGFLPAVYSDPNNGLGLAEDDISQLWLANSADTPTAVNALEKAGVMPGSDASTVGLGQIFYGATLEAMFNPPGVPRDLEPCCKLPNPGDLDPRTPDIVVIPNVGVVYTGSTRKQSEHGGYAIDDTNVMLLVSNPSIKGRTDTSFVETMQVAPTILSVLGLDPNSLEAVQHEGTPVLPGIDFNTNSQ
jgi:Type I phosphodiesterase / nucleotide pyrophosphatase